MPYRARADLHRLVYRSILSNPILNDYAPAERAAKTTGRIEVHGRLLETASNTFYGRLRMRLSNFRKDNLISTYNVGGTNSLRVWPLATGRQRSMTYEKGADGMAF
jgi:hypothetical protein